MNNTLTLSLPFSIRMPLWAAWLLVLKIVLGLLVVAVFCLLGLYLFQTGDLIAKSFALSASEVEMEELSKGNVGIYTGGNPASLEELEQRISKLNFVIQGEIRYIPIYPEQLVSSVK